MCTACLLLPPFFPYMGVGRQGDRQLSFDRQSVLMSTRMRQGRCFHDAYDSFKLASVSQWERERKLCSLPSLIVHDARVAEPTRKGRQSTGRISQMDYHAGQRRRRARLHLQSLTHACHLQDRMEN